MSTNLISQFFLDREHLPASPINKPPLWQTIVITRGNEKVIFDVGGSEKVIALLGAVKK